MVERKQHVPIELSNKEMSALNELCEKLELNCENVVVQALRCYQAIVFEQASLQWIKGEPKLNPKHTLQVK